MGRAIVMVVMAVMVMSSLSMVAAEAGLGEEDVTVKVANMGAGVEDVHYNDGSVELTVECVERFVVYTGSEETLVCVAGRDSGFYAQYDGMVVVGRNAEDVLVQRGGALLPQGTVFAHEMIHAMGGTERDATCYSRTENPEWVGYEDIECRGWKLGNYPVAEWKAIWAEIN